MDRGRRDLVSRIVMRNVDLGVAAAPDFEKSTPSTGFGVVEVGLGSTKRFPVPGSHQRPTHAKGN